VSPLGTEVKKTAAQSRLSLDVRMRGGCFKSGRIGGSCDRIVAEREGDVIGALGWSSGRDVSRQ
jgi:hypothetical protein